MKKRVCLLQLSLFAGFIGLYLGCNKTDHPFGVDAPLGLDVPTITPTPATGAIEVYVSDTGLAIQNVNIYLLDPAGNTFTSKVTQPVVGFAAFNPPQLISGVWNAVVPAQSVSYVASGPVTYKKTYGYSTLPITVSGGGSYSATFTTGNNTVQVSPVSQGYQFLNPSNVPVTVSYYENGNLNVPVSVSVAMNPTVTGINFLTTPNWVFGAGDLIATDTIGKNTCYYQPITLVTTANDFSGNPILTTSALISRGWSIPTTLLCSKTKNYGAENFEIEILTAQDCGATVYNIGFTYDSTSISQSGTVASDQSVHLVDGSQNYTVSCHATLPNGTILSGNSGPIANLSFDSWAVLAIGSY